MGTKLIKQMSNKQNNALCIQPTVQQIVIEVEDFPIEN